MTSTRRTTVLVAVALAVSVAAPAQAVRSEPPSEYGHPYEYAGGWSWTDCQEGAECVPTGAATPQGDAQAGAQYRRGTPTTGDELTSGHARITQTLQLPRKTRSARVSLVWQVVGATSEAHATQSGRVSTGTYLTARAWCGGKCTVEPVDEQLTYCGVDLVRPACVPTSASASGQEVTLTLTLTQVTTGSVQVTTDAVAWAGGRAGCLLARSDGTCSHEVPDDRHAGDARSSVEARLTSISIDASDG